MRSGYFDRQGNEIGLMKFAELFEDYDYKILKRTDLENCWVSTVWLGTDYDFYETNDKPIIFETMVFPNDSRSEEYCERYSTEEEALEGHERMVDRWRNTKKGDDHE